MDARIVLACPALLLVPGYVVHSLLVPDEELDPIAHLTLVVGLSLALIPLFLLFATLAGIRLNGPRVALAVGLLVLLALWRLVATRFRDLRCWAGAEERPYVLGMAFVLGLTLGVRFLQVRGLVVPAWVDSVHHTLIAQVMVERGGVPGGYEPYLPVGEFTYHFGFHGLVALWHWLTGLEVVKAVLVVGQVVNGLMGLGVYLLVERVTGDRMGGLVGALVVGLVSWMPGYYVTWGRYTQLMGMAMMPVVMVLTLEGLEGGWREVVLAGVGVGGLGLTHYRVLVFYGCWVVVLMCERRRVVWERGVGIGLVALLLTLPWWLRLAAYLMPTGLLAGYLQSSPSFNAVPRALIGVGGDRILFPLAACGLLWGLFRRERVAILILLWVALLLLITNPSLLGLSSTWLLSNSSLVISLFLPIAILVGYLAASLRQFIAPRLGHWAGFARYGVSLLIVLVALWGAWGMLSVVNPVTVLATRDDMEAMAWIREQTPRDAKFLINARHWQEGAYMGSDGGYWIPLLTGRQTTLPAVVYVYGPPSYVKRISTLAKTVAEANSLKDEGLLRLLEEERITHVYLGARGGSLTPQMFLDDPGYRLVYSNGAAWIFAVTRRG